MSWLHNLQKFITSWKTPHTYCSARLWVSSNDLLIRIFHFNSNAFQHDKYAHPYLCELSRHTDLIHFNMFKALPIKILQRSFLIRKQINLTCIPGANSIFSGRGRGLSHTHTDRQHINLMSFDPLLLMIFSPPYNLKFVWLIFSSKQNRGGSGDGSYTHGVGRNINRLKFLEQVPYPTFY